MYSYFRRPVNKETSTLTNDRLRLGDQLYEELVGKTSLANRFYKASVSAAICSMDIIGEALVSTRTMHIDQKITDGTLVTLTDKQSETAAIEVFQDLLEEVPIDSEEAGDSVESADYRICLDPLDGTGAFACKLPTPTVIFGLYDSKKHEIVASTIGEPATKRIWHSCFGKTILITFEIFGERIHTHCAVVDGQLSSKSRVFLDVFHGFARKGRNILTDNQVHRLGTTIAQAGYKLLIPGSNGIMQALVANGGEQAFGGFTTAMGGPFDAIGVSMVLDAGGYAKAYQVTDGEIVKECNPRNPYSFDVAVYANNADSLEKLNQLFHSAISST